VCRRAFLATLASGLLAGPLAATAQQAGRIPRVGVRSSVAWLTPLGALEAIQEGLAELGYVEGHIQIA
jgi:hypothetical protein